MHLHSPQSAILSARNLQRGHHPAADSAGPARRAVQADRASALLRRNLFIYGLGSVLVPFVGIKLIDLLISVFF